MARKEELWFHAKDIPGSHVVISGNLDPSDEVKTDAAELAAYFSQGRLSNLVQVDMIEVKKLNKPTGGKPGFVTYTGQKTLRVTPDPEKIASMKKILILLEIRIFFYILLCNQGFQTNLHHISEGILAFFCSRVFIWIDQAIRDSHNS